MFDAKGVCFAVTDGKYWTYAKPFGMYAAGQIDTASEDYFSNPTVLVDFLEPIGAECDKIYMAGAEKDFNILMCRDSKLCRTKKIFIERRSRQVKKIEYLNCAGNIILSVEADNYKNVSGAKFSFPRKLTYKYIEKRNLMEIKLDSVKLWRPEAAQLKALFTEPGEAEIKKEVK
jgi:hypothetical protein